MTDSESSASGSSQFAEPHHCPESVFRILGMADEECLHCGEVLTA